MTATRSMHVVANHVRLDAGMSSPSLPCLHEGPEMFFAQQPAVLEQARQVCLPCPFRQQCLAGALQRAEPWGVWGGEILEAGVVIEHKRPPGRPRKAAVA